MEQGVMAVRKNVREEGKGDEEMEERGGVGGDEKGEEKQEGGHCSCISSGDRRCGRNIDGRRMKQRH